MLKVMMANSSLKIVVAMTPFPSPPPLPPLGAMVTIVPSTVGRRQLKSNDLLLPEAASCPDPVMLLFLTCEVQNV